MAKTSKHGALPQPSIPTPRYLIQRRGVEQKEGSFYMDLPLNSTLLDFQFKKSPVQGWVLWLWVMEEENGTPGRKMFNLRSEGVPFFPDMENGNWKEKHIFTACHPELSTVWHLFENL